MEKFESKITSPVYMITLQVLTLSGKTLNCQARAWAHQNTPVIWDSII